MEMLDNKLIIDIPKGMEVDIEKSDLKAGIIAFKKRPFSYEDVISTLIDRGLSPVVANVTNSNVEKIVALDKLMDIAKCYNGDWKPDWNSNEHKHNIMRTSEYGITSSSDYNEGAIYFKNKEDAQAVIDNPNFRSILDAIYKD
jgi:hypothetical protein